MQPILVGTDGLTYTMHTEQALVSLGVPKDRVHKVLAKLTVHAIQGSERAYAAMMAARGAG